MFLSLIFVVFLFAVIQGFVRVVVFFWEWLSGGSRLAQERVEQAESALDHSESVLARELAQAEKRRGLSRLFARWQASNEAIDEYLDHLRIGWYQVVIIFFLGSMAGLLIEEVWMLATSGLTQSRPGLVWGPFSPLYGFGAVFLTILSFFLSRWSLSDCLAVGSGLGYYSLSSVLIAEYKEASLGVRAASELGTIALLVNIFRELFTLVAAQAMKRHFGPFAPVASAGATAMDVCLPVILRVSGSEILPAAIVSGIICDFSVPFLVSFFCSF